MPAEILSLDLDWFNSVERGDLKFQIRLFFARLKDECVLPSSIFFVPEHHYLYPWSVKILNRKSYRKMRVVNIDEHHDFYHLKKVDFVDENTVVTCANFFAFMVHKKMMSNYVWVTNYKSVCRIHNELLSDLKAAKSITVRRFKQDVQVLEKSKVFDAVGGRRFDGFMIVRSPGYTETYRAVYHAVEDALQQELPKTRVRRYKCREDFPSGLVHRRAQSLFPRV